MTQGCLGHTAPTNVHTRCADRMHRRCPTWPMSLVYKQADTCTARTRRTPCLNVDLATEHHLMCVHLKAGCQRIGRSVASCSSPSGFKVKEGWGDGMLRVAGSLPAMQSAEVKQLGRPPGKLPCAPHPRLPCACLPLGHPCCVLVAACSCSEQAQLAGEGVSMLMPTDAEPR